ncbi:hypothetical protein C7N83_11570, partial [Neisseria iguanae]
PSHWITAKRFTATEPLPKRWGPNLLLPSLPFLGKGAGREYRQLIRRYFQKGTDFRKFGRQQIKAVEDAPNRRRGKMPDYDSPVNLFLKAVQSGTAKCCI